VLASEGGQTSWISARTLTEARARRGEILAKRHKGERVKPPASLTLAQAVEAYFAQTRVGDGTAALYRHDLSRRELRSLLRRKVASITTDDVARLVRELEAPGANMTTGGVLAGSTIDNVLIALSAVFTLGVRRGWTQTNPVGGLTKDERPKSGKRPHRILTPDEIRRSVEAAGARWRVLVTTAVFSGMRQSELLGLSWRDIDLDAGRLSVQWQLERGTGLLKEPKTENGEREVPLPAFVVKALREHKLASRWSLDDHPVFASDVGGRLDHRNVGRMWERVRVKAGLAEPLPVFHDLRHTAASLWIAEGLDVVYVSRVLGHGSPSITLDVYAGLFNRERHEMRATAALDAEYGGLLEAAAQ
jgi:integrase